MSDEKVTHWFGVWIPNEGWVRGKDKKPFADLSIDKAKQVARLIGRGAMVRFIDESIVDLEHYYLEQEKRKVWQKIKITILRLLSSNSKKIIRN